MYCAAAGDSDGCARDARNVLDADPAWFTALTVDVNEDGYLLFKLLLKSNNAKNVALVTPLQDRTEYLMSGTYLDATNSK